MFNAPSIRSPERAVRMSQSIESRIRDLLSQLPSLTEKDPAAALNALEDLLSNAQSPDLDHVSAWLAENPAEATHWVESLPEGPVRNGVVERLLPEVASRDTPAALKIADTLNNPELRDSALSSVIRRWAAAAPLEALGAVAARAEWRDTELLGRAFVAAATAHPEQIEALYALIPSERMGESFLTKATETLLARDPAATARWFAKLENAGCRSAIAETLISHVGRNDPCVAFIWATQLPEPERRLEALQTSFYRTVQRNPATAPDLLGCDWLSVEDRKSLVSWLSETGIQPP
jgi:hypothetical protein